MALGLAYWIIMLIAFLGGGFYYRTQPAFLGFGAVGFLLFLILGIHDFGWPIHG